MYNVWMSRTIFKTHFGLQWSVSAKEKYSKLNSIHTNEEIKPTAHISPHRTHNFCALQRSAHPPSHTSSVSHFLPSKVKHHLCVCLQESHWPEYYPEPHHMPVTKPHWWLHKLPVDVSCLYTRNVFLKNTCTLKSDGVFFIQISLKYVVEFNHEESSTFHTLSSM